MGKPRDAVKGTLDFFSDDDVSVALPRTGRYGHTLTVGVHMEKAVRDAYDAIAARHAGLSRSAIMRYALRWFLRELEAGRAELKFTEMKQLDNP